MVAQIELQLKPQKRGFNLITGEILTSLSSILPERSGVLHLFIKHTSASLSISENADPTVRQDLETYFNRAVEEDESLYRHTLKMLSSVLRCQYLLRVAGLILEHGRGYISANTGIIRIHVLLLQHS